MYFTLNGIQNRLASGYGLHIPTSLLGPLGSDMFRFIPQLDATITVGMYMLTFMKAVIYLSK